MKLFQRIFTTFCMVIICAIFVVSFSFWILQTRQAENISKQNRTMEINLLANVLATFQSQGEPATKEVLQRWQHNPASHNVFIIMGDDGKDILDRPIPKKEIQAAHEFALKNPNSNLATIFYDPLGEENLFFIRHFDRQEVERLPTLMIPGLPLPPIWHEFIIFVSTLIIGLLLAYILANNISKPISIVERGMHRLASGELDTRVSQQLLDRKDELANLGVQFDKMAAQLQKLVVKERHLLHHVSHEMRSPLARMQAIVGLIEAQPHKQDEYLKRLENELVRMNALVGELLTLSRLETANIPMQKEDFLLLPFISNLVEDCQTVAQSMGHTLALSIRNIPEHARFRGNEGYLYQAFDNVIRNAMNYSPSGSHIDVVLYEDRKNLHIEVRDNGPGIKEEEMPKIFDSFYRASSSDGKQGTGLGLALTKHIIEQHSGKIVAENIQPNGLKMHFILPKTCKNMENLTSVIS